MKPQNLMQGYTFQLQCGVDMRRRVAPTVICWAMVKFSRIWLYNELITRCPKTFVCVVSSRNPPSVSSEEFSRGAPNATARRHALWLCLKAMTIACVLVNDGHTVVQTAVLGRMLSEEDKGDKVFTGSPSSSGSRNPLAEEAIRLGEKRLFVTRWPELTWSGF